MGIDASRLSLDASTEWLSKELSQDATSLFGSLDKRLQPNVLLISFKEGWPEKPEVLTNQLVNTYLADNIAGALAGRLRLGSEVNKSGPWSGSTTPGIGSTPSDLLTQASQLISMTTQRTIKETLERESPHMESHCSRPVLVDGEYSAFIVLQLRRDICTEYACQPSASEYEPRSFLEACAMAFLEHGRTMLTQIRQGSEYEPIESSNRRLLREAGRLLLFPPDWDLDSDFFDSMDAISSMTYEGAAGHGRIVLASPNEVPVGVLLRLEPPVPIREHRAVRKLLEMTGNEICLLVNADIICALADIEPKSANEAGFFSIEFRGHYKWDWKYGDKIVMQVAYGQPTLPKPTLSPTLFSEAIKQSFPALTHNEVMRLWSYVEVATKQKKGTIIAIAEDAKKEANRLRDQCTKITPAKLNGDLIGLVTAIDGAVLVDPSGTCFAIGAILDGKAKPGKGKPSRGSRYNSAIRYADHGSIRRLLVVVSEDGTAELVPEPASFLRH